jgi:hypothetical protein
MQEFRSITIPMNDILVKKPLFIFVFSYIMTYRNLDFDKKIDITYRICKKLKLFGHDSKASDHKELYVRYYLAGYFDKLDFDSIVKDGTFHLLDYEQSKKFFIEVYFGNGYLINKFQTETLCNPFLGDQAKKEYLEWLEENFKIYYDQYHKASVN